MGSSPLEEFQRAEQDGLLPAAAVYFDMNSGTIGIAGSGIHLGPDRIDETAALAFSDDPVDRVVAAVRAVMNVGWAAQREIPGACFCALTPQTVPEELIAVSQAARAYVRRMLSMEPHSL